MSKLWNNRCWICRNGRLIIVFVYYVFVYSIEDYNVDIISLICSSKFSFVYWSISTSFYIVILEANVFSFFFTLFITTIFKENGYRYFISKILRQTDSNYSHWPNLLGNFFNSYFLLNSPLLRKILLPYSTQTTNHNVTFNYRPPHQLPILQYLDSNPIVTSPKISEPNTNSLATSQGLYNTDLQY